MFGVWSCNTEDFTCSWSSLQLQSHAELDFVCYSVVLEIFIPCCHIIQQGTFFVLDAPCANMNSILWKPKKFDCREWGLCFGWLLGYMHPGCLFLFSFAFTKLMNLPGSFK